MKGRGRKEKVWRGGGCKWHLRTQSKIGLLSPSVDGREKDFFQTDIFYGKINSLFLRAKSYPQFFIIK